MDKKHQDILQQHRHLFSHTVNVQHLYPFLRPTEVLSLADVTVIDSQPTGVARAEKLLDILPAKGSTAFQTLCVALESTYPRLLTEMFIGAAQHHPPVRGSTGHVAAPTGGSTSHEGVKSDGRMPSEFEEERQHTLAKLRDDEWRHHGPVRTHRPLSFHESDLTPNSSVSLLKAELKVVSSDRNTLRDELQKVQNKLDSYKRITMSTEIKPAEKSRDYDWLKSQCDRAMSELQSLKQQHGDAVKKCDQARKDADHHRHNHKMSKDKGDQLMAELHMLKNQYHDIMAENQNLKHHMNDLEKQRERDRGEISELRQQSQEVINGCGSMDVINKMYEALLTKYEELEQEYNQVKKHYTDATMSREVQQSKAERLEEENNRLRQQCDDALQERNKMSKDWQSMQQHYSEVTQDSRRQKSEKTELMRQLQSAKMERDQYKRDMGAQATDGLKKLGRVKAEHDAVLQEYRLVMSERDSVHKEMDQMQDKLLDYRKRLDLLEKEKKLVAEQMNSLNQELRSTLQERDQALKDLSDVKEKYGERGSVTIGCGSMLKQLDRLVTDQDLDRDHTDRVSSMSHMYETSSKEHMDNKEAETLRKEVDKLQTELTAALQEMEGAKKTRDWAFTERDKIVRERESIRTLCDKLRHDRDKAVSKLAEAIRDSEELTKQKNDTAKELKELKDKYDTLVEKEARKSQLNSVGHNHSRDSAIDLPEWGDRDHHIELRGNDLEDLAFHLVGGKDAPLLPNDPSIFISGIQDDNGVFGGLRNNDLVIKVNNVDVANVERNVALDALRSTGSTLSLVVRRRRQPNGSNRPIHPVHINLGADRELGVRIEQGYYISRVLPGTAAAKEGTLTVGDRILHLNGHSLESLNMSDISRLMQDHTDNFIFNVLKFSPMSPLPHSSLVSSDSASSGQNLTETSPDAPSVSPQSPRSHHWLYCPPSPESAKSSNTKGSSGSRSDSLESPRQSTQTRRADSSERMPFLQQAKQAVIHKLGRRHKHNHMSKQERNQRCLSEYPVYSSMNTDSAEDSIIEDLNNIVNQHSKKVDTGTGTGTTSGKPAHTQRRRRGEDRANGGTWPKCRSPGSYEGGPVIPRQGKKRSPLPVFTNEHQYGANTQTPPTPPERSDSIKRVSMKHSSQNSVTAQSTHGYSHVSSANMTVSQAQAQAQSVKSNQYISSPVDTTNMHSHSALQDMESKSSFDNRGSLSSDYEKSLPQHFPVSSSQDSSSASPPEDYTVGSANESLSKYAHRIPVSRPTSAPSKRTRAANHRARIAAQKPTSLDIPPYSPRPLPHTHQNITPSNPFPHPSHTMSSPSGSSDRVFSTSPPPPYSVGQVEYRSASLTSPMSGFLPSDKPPSGHAHLKNQHHVPIGGPAPSQILRSTNPVFQVASSQVVSPTGLPPYMSSQTSGSSRYSASSIGQHSSGGSQSGQRIYSPSIHEMESLHYARERYSTPSPSPSQQSGSTSLTTSASEDFPYHKVQPRPLQGRHAISFDPHDGNATFPHRRNNHPHHERIRIPSNPSVLTNSSVSRISTSSFEKVSSERASPVSPFLISPDFPHLPPGRGNSLPMSVAGGVHALPPVGEIRTIHVEKSAGSLGINIKTGQEGGIFVSSVSEHSLASKAGIAVGDQILEVCGINMRNARYNEAASVLRQCGGSINMLVQFNPQKSTERHSSSSSVSSGRETPEQHRRQASDLVSIDTITPDNSPQTMSPSSLSQSHSAKTGEESYSSSTCEPRFVILKKAHQQDELGVRITGGNSVGIFVNIVQANSMSSVPKGLRCGDQILEFNGINFRNATAEQATMEMSKLADTVSILACYNVSKYQKIQDQPGDCLYVRAMFERQAENDGELSFKKDDILLIDDTVYNGKLGTWRAWLVDDEGSKYQCGTVPSKFKLEDELALKRSSSETGEDELKGSRRGSGSARRSFFKRKRHQRNNSKDSRDFHSFSDASINSDSLAFLADGSMQTFERVERLDCQSSRPVVILGPLAEPLISKLTSESPDKYCCPKPAFIQATISSLEKGQTDGIFVDFKARSDGQFQCTTLQSVKDIIDKKRHCLLHVDPTAVECLHREQIYPIVLFIKHKSPKQIREVKDTRFLPEKLSNKLAKELFELSQEHENKYKRYFSDTIQGGNLALMCCKIKSAIDKEQKKTIWVPSGCL